MAISHVTNPGKVERKNPRGLTWFNNVAKSLGYTTSQLISELAPSMSEFTATNTEYGKELLSDIRDLRTSGNKLKGAFDASSQMGHLRTAMKNAMADIKSGKIYNKEREDSIHDDGENFEFGMDDFEFDGDANKGNVVVPNLKVNIKNIQPPMNKNNPMLKIMQRQTQAIYETTQMTVDTNMKIAQNSMMMDHKNHGRTLQGLQTINDNLAMLVNFQSDSMTKYISSSLKYYEENLGLLSQTLSEIKKGQGQHEMNTSRKSSPADDVLLSNGGLSAKGYMGMVKSNLKKQFSENPLLMSMKAMFDDDMTLKYLAASPLSFLSTKIISTIVPKFLQQSISQLDKSFANFFPAMFMKLNRATLDSANPILQMIGEIFGLDVKSKGEPDLGKYNKGTVPFDGITRKSIVEVIPGYLRKILSALTGREEQAYDHNKGKFTTVTQMQDDFKSSKNSNITSAFSESLDEMRKLATAYPIQSKKDREMFMSGLEKFVVNLSSRRGLVNPEKTHERDGTPVDELRDVYGFEGNVEMQRVFRQLVLSMSKSNRTKLFGRDVIDARNRNRNFMQDIEDDPTKNNTATLFNGLGFDQHLDKDKKRINGQFSVKKGGILNPVDSLGLSSLDYLRDIKKVLLHGIRVFIEGGGKGGPLNSDVLARHANSLSDMASMERDHYHRQTLSEADSLSHFDDSDHRRFTETGRKGIKGFNDLSNTSDADISQRFKMRLDYNNTPGAGAPREKAGVFGFINRLLNDKGQENFGTLKDGIDNLLKKPAEIMKSIVTKIDGTLYNLVFGKPGQSDETSFFSVTMAKMRDTFNTFLKWTDEKVIGPLNNSLFGKEGLITKIKDSAFFKSMGSKMKNVANFVFGKPDGENGKRTGGMLSDTANSFGDMWANAKYYFNGKSYTNSAGTKFGDNTDKSVFGEVRSIFRGFKATMKTYLVGDKNKDGEVKEKGILTGALQGLKDGFHNFSEAIFGPRRDGKNSNETFKDLTEKFKARAPKSLAIGGIAGVGSLVLGSKLGLLGSLFLGGGPIGAAILGTSLGFLSQSEKFKGWLFGEKDADGSRVGGIISRSAMDFLKKNRVGIIGGATLGVVKSITGIGILPSFFMPGGPIGGALLGIGASMIIKSEKFQKMMFGEKDIDGNRMGGLMQKMFGQDSRFKKTAGNVGAGILGGAGLGMVTSHLGLMGAMLVPGGPIGGAILGAAAGIALSSDKWKSALFGDWDTETGKRKGGLLGKFNNWFKLEMIEPLKLQFKEISINIREWFTEKIGNPFREAIGPITKEFKNMTDKMTEMFKNGWDSFKDKIGTVFEKHVGQPFGQFMKDKVMEPLKGFFSRLVKGIGNIFGSIFAAPFKALTAVSQGLTERHKKQGLNNFMDTQRDEIFSKRARNDRFERGEKLGLFSNTDANGNKIGDGIFSRMFDMHFNKATRDKARTSSQGADYLRDGPAVTPEEKALQKERIKLERDKLKSEREKLKKYQSLGLKYDYDNFNEQGNDVSRIYDGLANGRAHVKKGRKINSLDDATFESMTGISLSSMFGKENSIAGMNPEDKTKIMEAMNGKLTGAKLQKFINAKFGLVNKLPTGTDAIPLGPAGSGTPAVEKAVDGVDHTITHDLIPVVKETNTILNKLLSVFKSEQKGQRRRGTIGGKKLSTSLKKFFNPGEPHSHASGIDSIPYDDYNANLHEGEMVVPADVANEVRNAAGESGKTASKVKGPLNSSNALVNGQLPKGKNEMLARIMNYTRIIAQEVKGQLDGVGGNVFRIRKILQLSTGTADEDMTGSTNRDRIGMLGKLRRMLFRPFETLRDKLMQGVSVIVDKVKAFGTAIYETAKAFVMIPVNMVKAAWELLRGIGGVLKEATITILKIPLQLARIVAGSVMTVYEGIKAVGPAIAESLYSVARLMSGAAAMAAYAMIGFGQGIGEFFKEFGKASGKFIAQIGVQAVKLTAALGKFFLNATTTILDFTLGTIGTAADFILGTLQMVSEKLLDVGNILLQIVTAPLKLIKTGLNKLFDSGPKEVIVKGGHLDSIGSIGKDLTGSKDKIIRVSVVKFEDSMPVYLSSNKIKESFRRIFPVPVTVEGSHGGIPIPTVIHNQNQGTGTKGPAMTAFEILQAKQDAFANSKKTFNDARAKVTFRTADYQKGKIAEVAKETFAHDSMVHEIKVLEEIAKISKEHRDGFMAIFGLNGLLTAGFLLALPFLKKIWDALRGFFDKGNNGAGNQSGDHAMDTSVIKVAEKIIPEVIPPAIKVAKTLWTAGKKTPGIVSSFMDRFSNSETGKALGFGPEEVPYGPVEANKIPFGPNEAPKPLQFTANGLAYQTKSSFYTDPVYTTPRPEPKPPGKVAGTVAKAIDVVAEESARVMSAIQNLLDSIMKSDAIKKFVGSKGPVIVTALMKDLQKFAGNSRFVSLMLDGMAKGTARIGSSLLTAGGIDWIYGAWNAVTGFFSTGDVAYLFNVHDEAVTPKMRVVSSIIKTILGVSYLFIIELLNAVMVQLTGGTMNALLWLANHFYEGLSSNEMYDDLKNAQITFSKEAVDAGMTQSQYNETQNKTIETKIVDTTKKVYQSNVFQKIWGWSADVGSTLFGFPKYVPPGSTPAPSATTTPTTVPSWTPPQLPFSTSRFGMGGSDINYNGTSNLLGGPSVPISTSQKVFPGFDVTSPFGIRDNPFGKGTQDEHTGIDLAKPKGSPIGAFVGGTVIWSGFGAPGTGYDGYGNAVAIKDKFGYEHMYGHLNSIAVNEGDTVNPGQIIGVQGTTGKSTGDHLHYEVRKHGYGTSVDPTEYLIQTNGGTTAPTSDIGASSTFGAPVKQDMNIFDLFGKMVENFSLVNSNLFGSDFKPFSLFDTTNSPSAVASGVSSSFVPLNVNGFSPALQKSIADKTAEILVQGEGGKLDAITSDASPGDHSPRGMSIGLMQWNKERARGLLNSLAQAAPNAGFDSFVNEPSLWTDAWWSDSRISSLKRMLNDNSTVVDQVERSTMANDLMKDNINPILSSGKLHDPRSIALLGDIGNTGPAYISKFLDGYSGPTNGEPEFPYFFKKLKANSYWANHLDTYGSRLDDAYNSLQSWMPDGIDNTTPGGMGGVDTPIPNGAFGIPSQLSGKLMQKAVAGNYPGLVGNGFTDSYRSLQNSSLSIDAKDTSALLEKVIGVLQEISGNTNMTAKGVMDIASKETKISVISNGTDTTKDSITSEKTSSGDNHIVLVNGGNKTYNSNPILGAMSDLNDKRSINDYNKAKGIAGGGKY